MRFLFKLGFNRFNFFLLSTALSFSSEAQLAASDYLYENPLEMTQYFVAAPIDETRGSGLEGVDAIYCINLEHRPEKYQVTLNQFAQYQLSINRFNGINGWKLDYKPEDLFGSYSEPARNAHRWLTPGAIGCTLSHLSILQDAYNRGLNCIWIVEDDLTFYEDPHIISSILQKLGTIDPDWDLFYTDPEHTYTLQLNELYTVARPELRRGSFSNLIPRKIIDEDIMTTGLRLGTRSYLFSRAGMKKVLHHFTHAYWFAPIDIELHLIEGIREYSCPRNLISRGKRLVSDTKYTPEDQNKWVPPK